MLNIDKVETVYIACGPTDLRKSIDGLVMIVKNQLQLNPFDKALFVFCNKQMDKLKILHFDEGFWLYYHRLEGNRFKWPATQEEAVSVNIEELRWLLKGYEVRTKSKFKPVKEALEGDDLICDKCGSKLVEIGVKSRKEILKYIPAKLIVEEHVVYSYACKPCEKENEDSKIVSPEMPKTIFYNSMASNELIAHTIALKYLHAMPLYRQQSYFDMMGATLSRQTLCNWTMSAAKALEPIYNYMKKELLNRNYIHADETTLKVINDNGKSSKSKKYMWLYMSETNAKPIILYDYQNTRSSSCPKAFLGEYSGYLQTDGYSGYNSVSEATRLYCLAHIRRKFYEIVENLDKEALKKSRGVIGFNYCEQIYKLEKELREKYSSDPNYYDIRYKERNEKLATILENFLEYIDKEIPSALPRSPLGKALDYAKKHVPSLKNVLLDGSIEVDNNAAEREIKPFVIGRKNFLFANTAKGATASSYLYSIIETAKANNLVIEKYLVYLFDNLINIDITDSECLENLMPWSNQIPDNLKIKK